MNYPNCWAIIKIIAPETIYKVLAGWSGSYLYGNSWQLNSGIVKVEEDGDYFLFSGHSGSVYKCHKHTYGSSMATAGVWDTLQKNYPGQLELMDEKTDWLNLIMENK